MSAEVSLWLSSLGLEQYLPNFVENDIELQLLPELTDADGHQGWLEFGRPPERMCSPTPPETRSYEPRAGRLILFPSWFWHQTLPFQSEEPRISVAFDVMPKALLRML